MTANAGTVIGPGSLAGCVTTGVPVDSAYQQKGCSGRVDCGLHDEELAKAA